MGIVLWKSHSLDTVHKARATRPGRPLPLWASILVILVASGLGWWLIARLIFWLLTM
jgi:hypothetical protein